MDIRNAAAAASFTHARGVFSQGGFHGVGFVLNGDGVVGVDLDNCVEGGQVLPGATRVLARLGADYVELSPSGRGLHVLGRGAAARTVLGECDGARVEMYSSRRFLTMTGHLIQEPTTPCLIPIPGYSAVLEVVTRQRTSTQEAQDTQEVQEVEETQDLHERHKAQASGASAKLCTTDGEILELPTSCVPFRQGQRHRTLFQLARFLKSKVPDASEDELYELVKDWHTQVYEVVGTKDLGISWGEFLHAWDNIAKPYGSALKEIVSAAPAGLPLWMRDHRFGYYGDGLLRMCLALSAQREGGSFFLTCRAAADELGCHFTEAASLLRALVRGGYLELIEPGVRHKGAVYRVGATSERITAAAQGSVSASEHS